MYFINIKNQLSVYVCTYEVSYFGSFVKHFMIEVNLHASVGVVSNI